MNIITKIIQYGFVVFLLFGGNIAYADNVAVEFEKTPLFSEANFLPEDSIARFVKVINNTGDVTSSSVRATNISNDKLGDYINLKIKRGETVFFDGTMTEFFDKSSVALLDLPVGQEVKFDFIATFLPTTNNDYQEESISFNLQMIFEEGKMVIDDVVRSSGNSSSGGSHLLIYNENGTAGTPATNSAQITWKTNIPSTSQVIYGRAGVYYPLDLDSPNFGYPNTTKESLVKTLDHAIVISDLEPGEYVYRVVSRASPPTVSQEFSFTISVPIAYSGGEILGASIGPLTQGSAGQVENEESIQTENNNDTPLKSVDDQLGNRNLAGIFSSGLDDIPWWFILLILFIVMGLYFVGRKTLGK